jgi:hypothetical protein
MVIIIRADGTRETTDAKATLRALQQHVGGYIERVLSAPIPIDGVQYEAWVNEEGLLQGLQYNEQGSMLCGQPLVGNVVLTRVGEVD